ncbi:MAG: hypothetical protein ABW145_02530, partial [Candidatus Thiodiazotropha sp.]
AIAMVDICKLDFALVVMEPRLQRHLKRYGLLFRQISSTFELKGERALYELPRSDLTCHMNPQILTLYDLIRSELDSQSWQGKSQMDDRQYNDPV